VIVINWKNVFGLVTDFMKKSVSSVCPTETIAIERVSSLQKLPSFGEDDRMSIV
jgi:hypothetical protein